MGTGQPKPPLSCHDLGSETARGIVSSLITTGITPQRCNNWGRTGVCFRHLNNRPAIAPNGKPLPLHQKSGNTKQLRRPCALRPVHFIKRRDNRPAAPDSTTVRADGAAPVRTGAAVSYQTAISSRASFAFSVMRAAGKTSWPAASSGNSARISARCSLPRPSMVCAPGWKLSDQAPSARTISC